jgi:hypothetical protein
VSWDGLVLPWNHPFWATHFPPNGWGCHCWIEAVDAAAWQAALDAGLGTAPEGWEDIDPKTGTQVGIDKGFDYTPGASVKKPLKDFIDEKLIKLDAPIGAAMYESMAPVLVDEMRQAVAEMVSETALTMQARGQSALVHVVSPGTIADLALRGVPMESADIWLRDEELVHALRAAKSDRGAMLPLSVWLELPAVLDGATPYLDTHDKALVFAFDLADAVGKVLVRVNYADKIRLQGKRTRITSNFVRTGGLVEQSAIYTGTQYVELEK